MLSGISLAVSCPLVLDDLAGKADWVHYVYLVADYLCSRGTLQAKAPWTAAMGCSLELVILVIQSFHHSNSFGGNQFPGRGSRYCQIADDEADSGSVLGGGSLPFGGCPWL